MSADMPFEAPGGQGRAVPFHCPYCAEEDLRPEEEPAGAWLCAGCRRVFVVRLAGLRPRGTGRLPRDQGEPDDGRGRGAASPTPVEPAGEASRPAASGSAAADHAGPADARDRETNRGRARRETRSSA